MGVGHLKVPQVTRLCGWAESPALGWGLGKFSIQAGGCPTEQRHLADPEINAQVILESAGQHPQKPKGLWGEWEGGSRRGEG